ncbi:MAG: retropepsin-like domain-containing protein [Flavobacteriales bacterium]|nr:retropepsin-like domain-containing protein [Flavobacteriales bacterium]
MKIPFEIIKMEGGGSHLLVKGEVNGNPANFIIDTGASRTVIDKNHLVELGLHKEIIPNEILSAGLGTNSMESSTIVLKKISLGKFIIKNFEIAVLDLSHVNEAYAQLKLPVINGVIGGDVLMKHKGIINYPEKYVRLIRKINP